MGSLALDKCGACGKPVSSRLTNCMACGWDSNLKERHCLKCERVVMLDNGFGFSMQGGGLAGLLGFIVYFFFGLLLGASISLAISALCGFLSVFTLGHKCFNCGKVVIGKNLTKPERDAEGKRRIAFLAGSILLAVVAVGLFFFWLSVMKSRFGA